MTISEFIKIRIDKMNITQNQLASMLGITRQNLNNKLSRDNFTSQELYKICKLLEVEFCLTGKDDVYKINY